MEELTPPREDPPLVVVAPVSEEQRVQWAAAEAFHAATEKTLVALASRMDTLAEALHAHQTSIMHRDQAGQEQWQRLEALWVKANAALESADEQQRRASSDLDARFAANAEATAAATAARLPPAQDVSTLRELLRDTLEHERRKRVREQNEMESRLQDGMRLVKMELMDALEVMHEAKRRSKHSPLPLAWSPPPQLGPVRARSSTALQSRHASPRSSPSEYDGAKVATAKTLPTPGGLGKKKHKKARSKSPQIHSQRRAVAHYRRELMHTWWAGAPATKMVKKT